MYKIHISAPLNDSNLVYKHSHFKKILNYLKNNNLKEFYVFSSNHDAIIVNHKYIFWKLSKSYQRKISSTIKVEVFSTKEKLMLANTKYHRKVEQKRYIKILNSKSLEYQHHTIYRKVRGPRLNCPFQTEYEDCKRILKNFNILPLCNLNKREVLIEQFTERMRQASYNARIHSENLGIKFL